MSFHQSGGGGGVGAGGGFNPQTLSLQQQQAFYAQVRRFVSWMEKKERNETDESRPLLFLPCCPLFTCVRLPARSPSRSTWLLARASPPSLTLPLLPTKRVNLTSARQPPATAAAAAVYDDSASSPPERRDASLPAPAAASAAAAGRRLASDGYWRQHGRGQSQPAGSTATGSPAAVLVRLVLVLGSAAGPVREGHADERVPPVQRQRRRRDTHRVVFLQRRRWVGLISSWWCWWDGWWLGRGVTLVYAFAVARSAAAADERVRRRRRGEQPRRFLLQPY